MRTIATMLLVVMAAIYLLMRRAPPSWAWAPYLGAFAEAGMVGACADWFAVVALFRHPLGLPIPHTAVVPENKRRIGPALGRFITNNFLSPRVAVARLSSVDFAGLAARWLEDERNARAVAAGAARAIPYALDLVPKAAIEEWVALAVRRGIEAVPAAPLASRGLSVLWAQGAGQTLLDQGLDFVEATLERNRGTIVRHVSQTVVPLHPPMGRRHDRRQGHQRSCGNSQGHARPRPSVARRGECVRRQMGLRPRPRSRDARERRGVEAGHPREPSVRRAGAGALGGARSGGEGRSAP